MEHFVSNSRVTQDNWGHVKRTHLEGFPLMMGNLNIGENNYLLERIIISESLVKHIENV